MSDSSMKTSLAERWENMTGKSRTMTIIGGGTLVAFVLIFLVFGGSGKSQYSNKQGEKRGQDKVDQHAMGGGRTNRASLEELTAQMKAMQMSLDRVKKQNERMQEGNSKYRQRMGEEARDRNRAAQTQPKAYTPTPRPTPNSTDDSAVIEDPFTSVEATTEQYALEQTVHDNSVQPENLQQARDNIVIQAPPPTRRLIVLGRKEEQPTVPGQAPPVVSAAAVVATTAPAEAVAAVEEEIILMPTGSVISGVLLHGTDAPASVRAKGEPVPVLIEVTDLSLLPNSFSADMRECRIIAGVYGDLSSERAKFRTERISCINIDGNTVDLKMEGYGVSQFDGIEGLKGPVVMRNGALLAKSILAATAADILSAYTLGFGRNSGGGNGDVEIGTAFVQGSGSGSSDGLNRIADYYLDRAEAIFAIVEIDSGRKIDFVLNRPMTIKVGDKAALGDVMEYTLR